MAALTLFPEAPEPKGRGHRLPRDWQPSPEARRFAVSLGLDPDAVAAKFTDYWCDIPGAKGRKLSWLGTFRNFCRMEVERQPKGRPGAHVTLRAPEETAGEWWRRLKDWRPGKFWSAMWGPQPSPDHPHPLIPRADYERWKAGLK